VKELLADDGVMLLYSIGRMASWRHQHWLCKYIFPGATPRRSRRC
jgi:cyclopropane fatty-acyl-phospholipid synthase-like methyltransferase